MDLASEAVFANHSTGGNTPRAGSPNVPPKDDRDVPVLPPPSGLSSVTTAEGDKKPVTELDSRASSSTLRPNEMDAEENPDSEKKDGDVVEGKMGASTSSLEQEVGQVMNGLSSWWGGFRKQSEKALEAVRKDVSRTVAEVQDEYQKLSTSTVEIGVKDRSLVQDDKGKAKEDGGEGEGSTSKSGIQSITSNPSAQAFLSRLQTTIASATSSSHLHLPDNLANLHLSENFSHFQKSVAETIGNAANNPNLDVSQLRTSLTQTIQKNLNGVNLKQAEKLAEEYLKKSEGLLMEAGEFLKDAVKVVPPEQGEGMSMAWDGSDMYSFSTSTTSNVGNEVLFDSAAFRGKGRTTTSAELHRANRKGALLRRLRSDKELFLVDPGAESESEARRETFKAYVEHEIQGNGGMDGDVVTKMIWAELGPDAKDAEALKMTRDALVPSQLSNEVFWTRYFFHKHQIELEEEKRKNLLAVTQQPNQEEDFSWDDNEEETTPKLSSAEQTFPRTTNLKLPAATAPALAIPKLAATEPIATPVTTASPEVKAAPVLASAVAARALGSSTSTSPRESEESYDIVSDQAERVKPIKAEEGSESDSDWE